MTEKADNPEDAGRICQITIRPDGRLYVFGICREVLDILESLGSNDPKLQRVLEQVRQTERNTEAGQ
ncbi:MAG TPA: hypothetical protein VHP11_01025 [Tepidisphaeraceae bacterium]|nr:hypothetical protein [Tepidisphaeraceae bacterium]